MHFNIAEVAPAGPAAAELLGPLLALSALIFALGCATLIYHLAKAVLGALAGIFSLLPFVGGIGAGAIRSLEQWITHELGLGIAKIEGAIGHQWHNLARAAGHVWSLLVRLAYISWEIAKLTQGMVTLGDIRHWLHDLRNAIRHALHIGTQGLHKAVHVERTVTRVLRHSVYPRLRAAEHAIDVTLPQEIKLARDLAREAEDGVKRLWDWTRNLADNPALTAAIATAIAALALPSFEFLRCSAFSKVLKRGCGGIWGGLEDLLGLFADALLLTHLCDLPKWINEIFGPLESFVVDLISGAATAACADPNPKWDALAVNVPDTTLPPSQSLGTLP